VETQLEIRLPDLGDVDMVRVVAWLVEAGTSVAEGDDLVEVETEKTTFVVPAPFAGRLVEVVAAEGATLERGGLLGRIEHPA